MASTFNSSEFRIVTTSGRFLKPGCDRDSPIGRPVNRISPAARPHARSLSICPRPPKAKLQRPGFSRPSYLSLEYARDLTAPSTVKSPLATHPPTPHADSEAGAEIRPPHSRTNAPLILFGGLRSLVQNIALPREYEFGTPNKISCALRLSGLTNSWNRDLEWQTVNSRHLLYLVKTLFLALARRLRFKPSHYLSRA